MQRAVEFFTGPLALVAALLIAATASTATAAAELDPIEITEWKVPFGGHPRDPFAAGGDAIWFVGQNGHYVARLTPSEGTFYKRDLPDPAGPHNLVVGEDGIVWYAGNRAAYVGRYDPKADRIEKIEMPVPAARDPHTLVLDRSGRHLWFTVQNGNFVGRLTVATRRVDLVAVPTRRARPYGIRIAPDGAVWIALVGTNKLASVDPGTLALTEHEIPETGARPRRLEVSGDGRIWYADYARGVLGEYAPGTRRFREWPLPSGEESRPYGMASDGGSRVWVVETGVQPNLFVEFDTRSERIVSVTAVPSGAGSVRHMDYHAASGTVWFGTDFVTIGRAAVGR